MEGVGYQHGGTVKYESSACAEKAQDIRTDALSIDQLLEHQRHSRRDLSTHDSGLAKTLSSRTRPTFNFGLVHSFQRRSF
jgi:hypothetical protein